MKFCEHCNLAVENDICPNCNKRTRIIDGEDMCFFGEYNIFESNMLIAALETENIPYIDQSIYFYAISAKFGKPNGKRIYLRYSDFDRVLEIDATIFGKKED